MMSNNISFVGRIGQDPELKDVGSTTVLEFSVANDTGFGDRKNTNWFRCAYWGKRGESVQQYLSKGKQVFISGELSLREYTDKEGVKKYSPDVNIQSLDFVGGRDEEGRRVPDAPRQDTGPSQSTPSSPETDEDMPF